MSQLAAQTLLDTATVTLKAVVCRGEHRHQSAEEFSRATHLVFPYRGVYVRHLGSHEAVAEANQVLFFNGGGGLQVHAPPLGRALPPALVDPQSPLRARSPRQLNRA